MTNMLRRAVGESVALRVDLGDDVGVVRADPGHLEQILLNLVVNARDAMPGGGSLLVRTRRLDAGDARGPSSPRGPLVELTVADSGVGMDEETRRHIFEPFFTTKAAGTGTGLGLATVYGIVRQGGGGIEVESAPGRGTTFTVLLPEDAADDAPDSASPAPASRRAGAVVLLAEDEEPLRRVIADVLARHGYTVLAAADGPEALARAAAYPGPIDVLLADVMMPRMSGRDLADALVTSRPETRVVFMSGHAADVVGQSGVAHGSTTLLQKPVTPAALAAKLRAVLRAPR
jgi:CheY-like chemotaxis protein